MKEIHINRLGTPGLQWQGVVESGQFVVLYFDVKSRSMRASNGEHFTRENGVLHVFETLLEARRRCAALVAKNARMGCLIYDAAGKLLETIEDEKFSTHYHGRPAAWRYTFWAAALFFGAGVCIVVDWFSGWRFIFGMIIGVKLLTLGAFFIAEGLAGLMYYYRRRRATGGTRP